MQKQWYYVISVTLIAVFLSSGFKNNENIHLNNLSAKNAVNENYQFDVITLHQYLSTSVNIPFIGRTFTGFKQALAQKESQGKYNKVNSLGYMGKYQFGATTLASVGLKDSLAFMSSPKLQEKAFKVLLSKNKWELREYIEKYEGTELNGILITESGILAAAHLGGVGSVKRFFKSGGTRIKKDAFGTSIENYLKSFSGYDTYSIPALKGAKVKSY